MTDPNRAAVMDGTAVANRILADAATRAAAITAQLGRRPCLVAVLVGRDPSSVTYVRMKRRQCESAGVESRLVELSEEATTAQVVDIITGLSANRAVDGILLQHPVPQQIDERAAFEAIRPSKDVDGVTMHSFASMAFDLPGFASCTPAGIMRLLDEYGIALGGRHAVVVGRSPILGKPVGMLMLARDATVTFCHSHTRDLAGIVRSADIVVAAVGRPNFIRGSWLRPGAVVIDAGYNNGSIGDVAFEEAERVASFITPVPGGVGPMTIAILIEQTVQAAERAIAGDRT
jgi:methylenetetrahydrofolate dehydrogenase (NADP+)/methenyltetrahydrofolate cyclohydrolase